MESVYSSLPDNKKACPKSVVAPQHAASIHNGNDMLAVFMAIENRLHLDSRHSTVSWLKTKAKREHLGVDLTLSAVGHFTFSLSSNLKWRPLLSSVPFSFGHSHSPPTGVCSATVAHALSGGTVHLADPAVCKVIGDT